MKEKAIAFLRRMERITKTDNMYAAKNGIEMLAISGIGLLNGVVIYLLYAHFIPPEVFGVYKYYLTLFGLFQIVTLVGIDTALTRSAARNLDGSLAIAFRRKLIGSAVGSIGFIGLAAWYAYSHDLRLALGVFLIAIIAPFVYATSIYNAFMIGKKAFSDLRRLTFCLNIFSFIVLAVGIFTLRNPLALLAVNLLSNLANVFGYLIVRKRVTHPSLIDPELVSYGYQLSGLEAIGTLASQLDNLLIFHFLGPLSLAVYSMANLPHDQLKGILKNSNVIAFPKFAAQDHAASIRQLMRKAWLFLGISAVCVACYIVCIPWVFRFLLPAYLASIPYTQVLSLSLIVAMPCSFIITYFTAQGLRTEVIRINLLNYLSLILLDGIGVMRWGVWGIVYAVCVNRLLLFIYASWRVSRLSRAVTQ